MENVFIFSSDVETIKTGYSDEGRKGHGIERVSTLVEERDLVERLRNIYPLGRCFIWGAQETEDNYLLWLEMEAEDFILGVRGRSIISAAVCLFASAFLKCRPARISASFCCAHFFASVFLSNVARSGGAPFRRTCTRYTVCPLLFTRS